MYMIQSLKDYLRRTTRVLALGLVVLGMAFLLACSSEQDTPTRVPQPTATPTVEAPSPQPTATPTAEAPGPQPTATPSRPPLQVVATSNIVADWAEVIGGDRVEVFGLVPPGSDPHNFLPGARDVARVAEADIVLTVGLGLEVDWLEELLHNASADESKVIALGEGVDPLEFMEMGGHGHDDHGDEHEGEFLEGLRNILHEVEDGHITAEQGLEEIEELLEGMDHHGEQEEAVHEIVHQFEDGQIDAAKAIEEIEHIAEGEEGHDHEGEFLEQLGQIIHEVEDGHITAEQGLEEIEELLAGMDHHGEQEEAVHEIVHQFEDGLIDAEKAIEEIEHIAEGEGHDDHGDDHEGEFLEQLGQIIHEVEDGHITAEQGLEEIEELLEGMDHHGEQEEAVHEIIHQFEDGQIDAAKAIEEIEHIAEGEGHGDEDEHGHEGHDHGPLDPHFWFDPNRVKIAVIEIATRLATLDPAGVQTYTANATAYAAQLDELHVWIQEQTSAIPEERRLLVTSHDTFAYFADIYGFEVIGAVVPSLAPDVEPSAEHLAELVEVIREHNAPAVFSETTVSGKLPEALARETGARLFQLYADSLGERGTPAGTYLGMMRSNVEVLVEALN